MLKFGTLLLATLLLLTGRAGYAQDAQAIYEKFKESHARSHFSKLHANFSSTYPTTPDNASTVTQEIQLNLDGPRYIFHSKFIQKNGISLGKYSWNGKLSVRFDYDEPVPGETPANYPYIIENVDKYHGEVQGLFSSLELCHPDNIVFHLTPARFDGTLMELAFKGKILEKIYFTNAARLIYAKIEKFDLNGNLYVTQYASDWKRFGPVDLPCRVRSIGADAHWREFRLKEIDFNRDFSHEDFIVGIPYAPGVYINDQRTRTQIPLSALNRQLIASKDYFGAIDALKKPTPRRTQTGSAPTQETRGK